MCMHDVCVCVCVCVSMQGLPLFQGFPGLFIGLPKP